MLPAVAIVAGLLVQASEGQLHTIRGVVVDEEGRPLAKAFGDFSGTYEKTWESGPDGAFQVTTGAPVLIIRRIGYHSAVIRQTDVTGDLRIVLRALPNGGRFPICAGAEARRRASSYELRMAQRTEVNRIASGMETTRTN